MTGQIWMRGTATLSAALAMCVAATLAFGATTDAEAQPPAEKKVTVQATAIPVIDAIDLLFKDTGYKYTIEPGVSGTISFSLKDMPFDDALTTVARSAGLVYEKKAGRYIIKPKPKPEDAKKEEPAAKDETSRAAVPEAPVEEGPILYGHVPPEYFLPPPFALGVAVPGVYVLPPYGFVVFGTPRFDRVVHPLPPPHLRSQDLIRVIDFMRALYSNPAYPIRHSY